MVLFAYNFPHRKTQDFILFCVLNKIPIKIILAQNKIELNHEKISFNFKNDIPSIFNPKNLADFFNIDYHVVDHNSKEAYELIKRSNAKIGLISGARILNKSIIDLFKIGIINFHPGEIPYIRGLYSPLRAIKANHRQVLTSHLIDYKIDAGKVIIKKEIEFQKDNTISQIYEKLYNAQFDIFLETIKNAKNNNFQTYEYVKKYDTNIPYLTIEDLNEDFKKYDP